MSERPNKIIYFRAYSRELTTLSSFKAKYDEANNSNITTSNIIRLAINNIGNINNNSSELYRKLIDELNDNYQSLYRIGGNINQIAHKLNLGGSYEDMQTLAFNNIKDSINEKISETKKLILKIEREMK